MLALRAGVRGGRGRPRGLADHTAPAGRAGTLPLAMRFTFLGTGTSAGVPCIACDCPVCTSPDPRDQRSRTGAALSWTDPHGRPRTVLIDATPDLRLQAVHARLRRCDAVLFTHNHVDHTFGLDEVRRFNAVQRSPIDVWAEDHTMDHLRRVYAHIFERQRNVNDSFVATLIPRRLEPLTPIDLWGLRVTPLRLLHGRLPVLGFRFDLPPAPARRGPAAGRAHTPVFPLAYCTDVSAIPPETYPHLEGLGTLCLDALRKRHHPTHLTLDQAVEIAGRLAPARALFIHIAHDLPHAATCAELPEPMSLAHDGLTLEEPDADGAPCPEPLRPSGFDAV
ncbi:MAG: MBL fold metallo-hydrolase [Planctomyces sp.]|nr:MBL fold metallo-hydrolase [Planctomyces sp.]